MARRRQGVTSKHVAADARVPLIARFAHPPLAAVVQPIADVAVGAVELIIADQAGQDTPDTQIAAPASLVVRRSTAPPRSVR